VGFLRIGERPEYRPFCDWRSVPEASPSGQKSRKGLYTCPFPTQSRAGIFSLFRNSDRLTGTFHWSEIPVQPCWYLPLQKIPLAENRFLQAGKGAENTKENPRLSLTDR